MALSSALKNKRLLIATGQEDSNKKSSRNKWRRVYFVNLNLRDVFPKWEPLENWEYGKTLSGISRVQSVLCVIIGPDPAFRPQRWESLDSREFREPLSGVPCVRSMCVCERESECTRGVNVRCSVNSSEARTHLVYATGPSCLCC